MMNYLIDREVEWFEIEKKRPDTFGHYLTYNAKTKQMMVLSYSPEYCTFGIYDTEVTHWMPMPVKPPESEDL